MIIPCLIPLILITGPVVAQQSRCHSIGCLESATDNYSPIVPAIAAVCIAQKCYEYVERASLSYTQNNVHMYYDQSNFSAFMTNTLPRLNAQLATEGKTQQNGYKGFFSCSGALFAFLCPSSLSDHVTLSSSSSGLLDVSIQNIKLPSKYLYVSDQSLHTSINALRKQESMLGKKYSSTLYRYSNNFQLVAAFSLQSINLVAKAYWGWHKSCERSFSSTNPMLCKSRLESCLSRYKIDHSNVNFGALVKNKKSIDSCLKRDYPCKYTFGRTKYHTDLTCTIIISHISISQLDTQIFSPLTLDTHITINYPLSTSDNFFIYYDKTKYNKIRNQPPSQTQQTVEFYGFSPNKISTQSGYILKRSDFVKKLPTHVEVRNKKLAKLDEYSYLGISNTVYNQVFV